MSRESPRPDNERRPRRLDSAGRCSGRRRSRGAGLAVVGVGAAASAGCAGGGGRRGLRREAARYWRLPGRAPGAATAASITTSTRSGQAALRASNHLVIIGPPWTSCRPASASATHLRLVARPGRRASRRARIAMHSTGCAALLAARLVEAGASCRRGCRAAPTADHVLAEWPGGTGRRVLLVGHFDTVWPVGQLARMPIEERGRPAVRPRRARHEGRTRDWHHGRAGRSSSAMEAARRPTHPAARHVRRGSGQRDVAGRLSSSWRARARPCWCSSRRCRAAPSRRRARASASSSSSRTAMSAHAGANPGAGASAIHEMARQIAGDRGDERSGARADRERRRRRGRHAIERRRRARARGDRRARRPHGRCRRPSSARCARCAPSDLARAGSTVTAASTGRRWSGPPASRSSTRSRARSAQRWAATLGGGRDGRRVGRELHRRAWRPNT